MAKYNKDGPNVDKGSGSKKGSSGHDTLNGTSSVDRHEKTHDVEFAQGGNTAMFGHQQAGEQKSGGTAHKIDGSGDQSAGTGEKFAKGGTTKMFGFAASQPATAGISSAR